jgi:hypothetical protein
VHLEIGVMKIFLKLASKVNGGMLEFRHFDSSVVFVLPSYAEILDDVISLLREFPINGHSTFGIHLGHLKEVA